MDDIVLEFDTALPDYLHADRLWYSRSVFAKVDKAVAALLVAAGIAMVALVGARGWCFLPFPLAVCEWFNLFSIRPFQIRLWFRHNPKFKERYRLRFSPDEIHFKTESVDSKIAWTQYRRLLESDRVFLMVYGKRLYSVIPKSAFRDSAEIDRFRSLVTGKLAEVPRRA